MFHSLKEKSCSPLPRLLKLWESNILSSVKISRLSELTWMSVWVYIFLWPALISFFSLCPVLLLVHLILQLRGSILLYHTSPTCVGAVKHFLERCLWSFNFNTGWPHQVWDLANLSDQSAAHVTSGIWLLNLGDRWWTGFKGFLAQRKSWHGSVLPPWPCYTFFVLLLSNGVCGAKCKHNLLSYQWSHVQISTWSDSVAGGSTFSSSNLK